jgi:hypothetical protein
MTRPGWKISVGGLVVGILLGIIYFALAFGSRIALGYLNNFTQTSSYGITITSGLFNFVDSYLFLILVGALVIVKIVHRTIKSPLTVRGPLKVALGAITGIFYYLILTGGTLAFTVGIHTTASGSFELAITILITLGLLELSAVMKILQGAFEFRDGRKEAQASLSSAQMQAPPPPLVKAPEVSSAVPTGAGPQGIPAIISNSTKEFCGACGKELDPEDAFCGYCGTPTHS